MKESDELKVARTEYLAKLTRYGGLQMPATAHYTAGYKDGSNMLWAIAQTCAEAERRLALLIERMDQIIDGDYDGDVADVARKALEEMTK